MLNKQLVHDVLNTALTTGGDFAEVYIEDRFNNSLEMIQGKIESVLSGRDYGVGIRIFKGTNSVYTYTSDASRENLLNAAKSAAVALKGIPNDIQFELVVRPPLITHPVLIKPQEVPKQKKLI